MTRLLKPDEAGALRIDVVLTGEADERRTTEFLRDWIRGAKERKLIREAKSTEGSQAA